jgi:hypothetical protein
LFSECTDLTSITYGGTLESWKTLSKGTGWDNKTPDYIVYCSNGDIAKDGTETKYSKGLDYTVNSETNCEITGIGTCTDTKIIMLEYLYGYRLTSIGEAAFANCDGLTSVTIPNSVTKIGARAFAECDGLTEIHYIGTIEQWQAVSKESYWDSDTLDYAVYCTDGKIAKDGTSTKHSKGFEYTVTSETTCEITGMGTCADADVVIPEYIDGYKVTVDVYDIMDWDRDDVDVDSVDAQDDGFSYEYWGTSGYEDESSWECEGTIYYTYSVAIALNVEPATETEEN